MRCGSEFRKLAKAVRQPEDAYQPEEEPAAEVEKPSQQEYWLLKLLLLHEELVPWAATHADPAWIQNAVVRDVVQARFDAHARQQWSGVASLLDAASSPEMRSLVTEVTAEERPIPEPAQQLADLVMRLRNLFIDRQLSTMTREASSPNVEESHRLELLRKQQELRLAKRSRLEIDSK
jgi:hypothetical protein